jgi:hypothetical protein
MIELREGGSQKPYKRPGNVRGEDISEFDSVREADPNPGSSPREGDQLMIPTLVNEAVSVAPPA